MISFILFALLLVSELSNHNQGPELMRVPVYNIGVRGAAADRPLDSAQAIVGGSGFPSASSYRLSGEKSLRPSRIGDDGVHMYLEWSEDQALPAVFALNAIGEEEMVDGYMRAGIFTIDRVHRALVFRIGKKRASAERVRR